MERILVVDDEEAVVEFVASLLEDSGYEVLRAYDGRSALEVARAEHPDVVITDIMMPVMSGVELCRELRNSPETSHIPVILMTAGRPPTTGCPGTLFLAKPFDIDALEEAISCALRPREAGVTR